MKYKKCSKCKKELSINNFGLNKNTKDGHRHYCKQCNKEFNKKYNKRLDPKEKARRKAERDRKRELEFKKILNESKTNMTAEECLKLHKQEQERKQKARKEYLIKYYQKNKYKVKAQAQLNRAVRLGKVNKPLKCSKCGEVARLHGHHEDYSKALDVVWLCQSCHQARHKELSN